jgi:uncharacterized protein YndB with AHSA1/START domain
VLLETASSVEVRVTQRYAAPADSVFDAWIDPAIAGGWLFATAWRPMSHVEIDARRGGSFRFADRRGAGCAGQYLEIARPRRLVFTLAEGERPTGVTRVSVEIVPLAAGCELILTHEKVPPEHASRIEGRWTGMLYGLGTRLGTRAA